MRIKLFRIGMRDLYCILSHGVNQLGEYVTAHSTTIPEGARVHHLNTSRSGMYLDVWMEHESFPEIADYDEPTPDPAMFEIKSYRVVGKSMVLDNLTPEELIVLKNEVDNRIMEAIKQPGFESAIDMFCQQMGMPKRVFVGSRLYEADEKGHMAMGSIAPQINVGDKVKHQDNEMEVLAVNKDKALCEWTRPTGLKDTAWFDLSELAVFNATTLPKSEWIGNPVLQPVRERLAAQIQAVAERALHPAAEIDVETFMQQAAVNGRD